MYDFHVSVHRLPDQTVSGERIQLRDVGCPPIELTPESAALGLLVTFEQAEVELGSLPRMFFEPDGSFVWVGEGQESRWQVDGELYDGGATLAYAELRGRCPADAFDKLLHAFGWPELPLMFQLMREAVYLDETAFRRYAGTGESVEE